MRPLHHPLLLTGSFLSLVLSGCGDDERDAPYAPHPDQRTSRHEPVPPSRTQPQAKVTGTPADGASADPQQPSLAVPPEKSPSRGKDATR